MGVRQFQQSAKEIMRPENLAMVVLFGLFFSTMIIQFITKWFPNEDIPSFFGGPYIMLFIALGGVYIAIAVIRRTWTNNLQKEAIAAILIAAVLIAFLLVKFKAATAGTLFEEGARAARLVLNLR